MKLRTRDQEWGGSLPVGASSAWELGTSGNAASVSS
jgi:hypothetical protein